jgi:hypothetical protein
MPPEVFQYMGYGPVCRQEVSGLYLVWRGESQTG